MLRWFTPTSLLGLVTINGSDTNRLLGYVGDAVWEDTNPHRQLGGGARFISQGAARTPALGRQLTFSTSDDGLNWTIVSNWTCCNHPNSTCDSYDPKDRGSHCSPADGTRMWSCPGCDTQSVIFWDWRREEYAMFTRAWVGTHGGGTAYRSIRRLDAPRLDEAGCRTPDGVHRVPADKPGQPEMCWTNDQIVMAPDAVSNATHATDPGSAPAIDYYGATVWQYPGVTDGSVYFMFPERVWHYIGKGNTGPMPLPAEIDVGLAVSRDGANFSHISGREALLPLGPDGAFDSRMTWVLPSPQIRGDRIYVYYAGSHTNHNGVPDADTPAKYSRGGISVAFARIDGLTSLDVQETTLATTKVLTFACGGCVNPRPDKLCANHLQLNVDSTTAHGMVRVALLHPDTMAPLPGFSLNDSLPLVVDSPRAVANWTKGADVSALRRTRLRVQIEMGGTKLYSLQFVPAWGS